MYDAFRCILSDNAGYRNGDIAQSSAATEQWWGIFEHLAKAQKWQRGVLPGKLKASNGFVTATSAYSTFCRA